MSKGGSDTSTAQQNTSTQALDPQLAAALYGNLGSAQALGSGYQPYSGALTAPTDADQQAYFTGLQTLAGSGVGGSALTQGVNTATGVSGYAPQTITAGQLSTTNLQPYMDPYTQSVIGATMDDLGRQTQQQLQGNAATATAAGAYNGTRQGVEDSLTNEAAQRTAASTLAGLNSQNYTQAQQAAQSDIAGNLAAQQGNVRAGLAGQGVNLSAAQALGGLSNAQLGQAEGLNSLLGQAGYGQQQQAQTADTASYQAWLQNLQNQIGLQGLTNQSLGLIPKTGTTSTSGAGSSNTATSAFNLASLFTPNNSSFLGGLFDG
jgi:hypothetical protein